MERIATTTLRRTCRSAIRSNKSRTPCLASRICPARFLCSSPSQSSSPSSTPRPRTPIRRQLVKQYSTESSIQGTIGKGEEGIRDEVVRERVVLSAPEYLNEKEAEIFGLLAKELEPVELEVQDISGGCGSMYGISITSEKFRGLGMLKQQRLVNMVLGEQIKGWHGVQLRTKIP